MKKNTSRASSAWRWPEAAARRTSRMSADTPLNPASPLSWCTAWSIASTDRPRRSWCSTTAGSKLPDREPITRPSRGVKPMEVSLDCCAWMAQTEQPPPRCRLTTRRSGWFSGCRKAVGHVLVADAVEPETTNALLPPGGPAAHRWCPRSGSCGERPYQTPLPEERLGTAAAAAPACLRRMPLWSGARATWHRKAFSTAAVMGWLCRNRSPP